ncbi:glycoside hydrolase family 172 protein [Paenibacillus mendelii]|uniref:Glycoside hydrolase family 172 protein n=1 Tax=Paenibacillus mendelii TaxID=206163 RepID=A0ABV6JFR6_9BACL|nr:glycoside hydrolase family 172 protein [Paenibacillus mendelii]MCQ6557163.1 DUF2961 domain-containing protein [Paenibacillus mendelii]
MNSLNSLFQLRHDLSTKRISSFDRKGGFHDSIRIEAGETRGIAEIEHAGIIKHIWITMNSEDPMIRRNAVIRMYWDGEANPSVEAPIGDFFGQGWGEKYNYSSLPMAAAPQDGQALNCYFPMPFGNGARITIQNESDQPIMMFFFYVDYEVHPAIGLEAGRFHAYWNRELTEPRDGDENEWLILDPNDVYNTTDRDNYLFADIEGSGHFVGVHYFVD